MQFEMNILSDEVKEKFLFAINHKEIIDFVDKGKLIASCYATLQLKANTNDFLINLEFVNKNEV